MKNLKQTRRNAKALFRSCFLNGVLDENRARRVVQEVISRRPRGFLALLGHFQRLIKLEAQRRAALIESAVPLPPELQKSLQEKLTRLYGPGLNFTFSQNSALIGGLRIRVGSDVYDGTVQNRLRALEQSFSL